MKKQQGFTLIELLVVIAIIGVLSAVVLASLNTARTKGNDVGVKANLSTVTTQAALYLSDNNNTYGTFANAACPAVGDTGTGVFYNTTIENAIAAAILDSSGGSATCSSTDTAYAVAVSRPSGAAAPRRAPRRIPRMQWRCRGHQERRHPRRRIGASTVSARTAGSVIPPCPVRRAVRA